MKDLGDAKLLLGLQIDRLSEGLFIHQQDYAIKILHQFRMIDCKPVSTPCAPGDKFTTEQSPTTPEAKEAMKLIPYREAIGMLLFLARSTRPDILMAVISLSRFNCNPGPLHWSGIKRIIRYLKGTIDYDVMISNDENKNLTVYSDADWANNPETRKSVSGVCMNIGNTMISYKCKQQKVVALSTMESELYA